MTVYAEHPAPDARGIRPLTCNVTQEGEVRDHLELALASLDRMREVLPPPNSSPALECGGGESA